MQLGPRLGFGARSSGAAIVLPFTPSSIFGLKFWLDAADTGSISHTGGAVSQINDKSGNGHHATQVSIARPMTGTRTLNGLNVLDFDGSDDGLNIGLGPELGYGHTIFVVAATDTPSKAGDQDFIRQLNTSNSTRQRLGYSGAGTGLLAQNGSSGTTYSMSVDASPHIFAQYSFSQNLEAYIGGVRVLTAASTPGGNAGNLGVGRRGNSNGNPLDGYVAEVLIYQRALDQSEINQVGAYLAAKWNLAWSAVTGAKSSLVTFGDSITAGQGASTTANRWANIVATNTNSYIYNQGISGSLLQNTLLTSTGLPGSNNGRDRYVTALLNGAKADNAVLVYGVNDSRNASSEPSLTLSNFIHDYEEILNGMLSNGYSAGDITIGSLPYYTSSADVTLIGQYNTAIRNLAVDYNLKYADIYNMMASGGGTALLGGDNLHPNDSGHAVIAAAVQAAGFVS